MLLKENKTRRESGCYLSLSPANCVFAQLADKLSQSVSPLRRSLAEHAYGFAQLTQLRLHLYTKKSK
jgi:hypothetical protein